MAQLTEVPEDVELFKGYIAPRVLGRNVLSPGIQHQSMLVVLNVSKLILQIFARLEYLWLQIDVACAKFPEREAAWKAFQSNMLQLVRKQLPDLQTLIALRVKIDAFRKSIRFFLCVCVCVFAFSHVFQLTQASST